MTKNYGTYVLLKKSIGKECKKNTFQIILSFDLFSKLFSQFGCRIIVINDIGNRKKRGLFQSSVGKLLNADTNGAIGICLKKYPAILNEIVGSGLVFRPYSINNF
jgi:hypothetical protein